MRSTRPDQPSNDAVPPAARLRHILVVDDEPNQVRILKTGLDRLPDCEVMIATGGQEALDLFARQAFDLMITDYRMPQMNGLQLAQAVRQLSPLVYIIMLTGFDNGAHTESAGPSPVQLVLEKPVDIRHIRSAVQAALDTMTNRT